MRRVYNAYLEGVWFAFPMYRTQPPREHKLKTVKVRATTELGRVLFFSLRFVCVVLTSIVIIGPMRPRVEATRGAGLAQQGHFNYAVALNLALYYGLPGYVRASCGLTPPVCLMSDWILTCTCSAYNSIQPRLATGRHRNPYKNASCG